MTSYAPTTIAALCFAKPTRIDFQSLTRNLGTAFAAAQAAGDCITAAHDDFVIYDLGRARVWLCYADFTADLSEALGAGGLPAEGLIVAVGPGPGAPASDPLYTDRADLCRGLAQEINRAAPADHLMVFDHERMITSDIYDELVDLVGRLARPDAAHRTVTVAPFLSERPVIPGRHTPSEPPRPTHAARSADRTAVDAVGWADATQRAEAAALREALHAEDDAADDTGTAMDGCLTRRLAIYTMNSGAIMLSVPLGMAALTYCALGREDARVPARAIALAGAAMGLMQAGIGAPLLSYLV
jgi:hypothetical protein